MEDFQRPQKSDFLERKGAEFRVSRLDGGGLGVMRLSAVRDLESPDADGLRELECFGLTFDRIDGEFLEQGCYLLKEGSFQVALFLIPESSTQMGAVIS